jgi:hypothetical protein
MMMRAGEGPVDDFAAVAQRVGLAWSAGLGGSGPGGINGALETAATTLVSSGGSPVFINWARLTDENAAMRVHATVMRPATRETLMHQKVAKSAGLHANASTTTARRLLAALLMRVATKPATNVEK